MWCSLVLLDRLLCASEGPVARRYVENPPAVVVPADEAAIAGLFPAEWRTDRVRAQGTPVAGSEVPRTVRLVKSALSRYGPGSLAPLKTVVCLGSMSFFGLSFGGTNSLDTLYICNAGEREGYTDAYIYGAVHHEYSSILLRNNPGLLDRAQWDKALPPGFSYLGDGTDAIREGTSDVRFNPRLFSEGFLADYSRASLEEDFNLIAENLFVSLPEFWAAVDRSQRLRAKVELVAGFYERLDPGLNLARFRSTASPVPAR